MLVRYSRGDTLIEVLLAVTVFSLVAVGVITVMNQGTNAAQRAIEITHVRQQIDAQVEALRAAQQAYAQLNAQSDRESQDTVWNKITENEPSPDAPLAIESSENGAQCPDAEALINSFAMNPYTAEPMRPTSMQDQTEVIYPQFFRSGSENTVYGLWIERTENVAPNAAIPSAYDFRVRACWEGAGVSAPMQLETTVRLYDVG